MTLNSTQDPNAQIIGRSMELNPIQDPDAQQENTSRHSQRKSVTIKPNLSFSSELTIRSGDKVFCKWVSPN